MKKREVVTFKADEQLMEALANVPNRSDFIRNAILHALENVCPLCNGTGIMTPEQREHWEAFSQHHSISECEDCHAVHLVCEK